MVTKGWSREFDEPIELPKGHKLVTLRDAALYAPRAAPEQKNVGLASSRG